ncbi:hypothetical protein RFI_23105 [Reticulomyxa filosa]|uniref:Uncharacterized protein n=1 Tax=Reticulomyxa filosa TaxID=46433 RepID=X6MJS2_RETFI|nr:hypothetical protein RFI_23105 [Reticulomyxa filosa]|eukprot:ETO14263.1 hypothetical protein RFI_23105 [Reticulomyxa filosa]
MESCIESMEKMLLNKSKSSNLSDVFCGYCQDTLYSALLYLAVRKAKEANEYQNDEKKNTVRFDEKELETKLLNLFKPLYRPEIMTNIQTDKDIKFYCLEDIIKIQQKKSKDQMVMILTNDMEYNIPMERVHCTQKIRSFKKVEQFEKTIKAFFKMNYGMIKNQLEQIIHILQLEHYQFYNDSNNSQKQKLVILLIHSSRESSKKSIKELNGKSNKELSFPLIFRQKWKIVYVDYLLSTNTISLKNDLKLSVNDVAEKQSKQVKYCFFKAFGRLHFPRSINPLEEKKLLPLVFDFKDGEEILKYRLKGLLFNATKHKSVMTILRDLEENGMKKRKGSYFVEYHNTVDTLVTLAFVNVLSAIYQNGAHITNNSKKYVESKKNDELPWYVQFFEKALRNEELVEMKPVSIDSNYLLSAVIDPQLYSIQTYVQHSFPFSRSIHNWCQQKLLECPKSPNDHLGSVATKLEEMSMGNDDLTQWDMDYSLKVIHKYVMDLVRYKFSSHLHTQNQQIILQNIIVSMALLLCGKLSIATIEVTIHYFRQIIFHYAYLISVSSDKIRVKHVPDPESWLMETVQILWKEIPIRANFDINESAMLYHNFLNFLSQCMLVKSESLMNELLQSARKIEIRRLGIIYLRIDGFAIEEQKIIKHGFLEHEELVDSVLKDYRENRNTSQEKYADFILDLLAAIKRVENVEKNKVYTSILRKLYSQIDNGPIFKMQIYKEIVLHTKLNNSLTLHSEEAVLLNRCFELITLNEEIKKDNNTWSQLCNEKNTTSLGSVAKISKVKVDVTNLISVMVNENFDLSQLKENQSIFRLLENISESLSNFSSFYKQYEHALYVWFLKQLYARKGMHWIEIIFAHPSAGTQFPFLKELKTSTIFNSLCKRTLRNISFNPFIGVYGDSAFMEYILEIMNDKFADMLDNHSLDTLFSPQMLAESLILIRFHDNYNATDQIQSQFLCVLAFESFFSLKFMYFSLQFCYELPIRDTVDIIVATLGFHFLSILPFMKSNPFQLLLADSESCLPTSTTSNEPLIVHGCLNNNALSIDESDDLLKQVKCQMNGRGASIVKTILKQPIQQNDTTEIDMKESWLCYFKRYMTSLQCKSSKLKPLIPTLLQLLHHLLLFLRNESIPQDTKKIQQLIGQTNQENSSKYLWRKIKILFEKLKVLTKLSEELLCIAIHLWIKNFFEKFKEWYPKGLPNNDLQVICEFEEKLDKEYSTFFNCKAEFIKLRNKSEIISDDDKKKKWLELMSEIEEIKELDKCYKIEHLPQLFLKVEPLSWRDLFHVFTANPSLANSYSLTAQLSNWDECIWYLQYLPNIVRLIQYVHNKYSRQLMPDELHKIQEDQMLKHLYECSKNYFVKYWNYFGSNCPQFQRDFKDLPIDQVCITNSNVNDSQFSIYQIIRHLEHQQNEFLKEFAQSKHPHIQIIEEKKEEQNSNNNEQRNWKSVFDITDRDILCFNPETLNAIIQRRSTPVLDYGQSDISKYFNLAAIESDIYHTFVHGRQQITFIIPLFEYRNEFDIPNCITAIENKYEALKDAQFQSFWNSLRFSTLYPLQKQRALEMVNDAIVHLFRNIDEVNIDKELTELFKDLKFEKKDWIIFDKLNDANHKTSKLFVKHIGALWKQLKTSVQSEQLDENSIASFVLDIYQQPLTNEIETEVKEFVNRTSLGTTKSILNVWRKIAYEQGQTKRNTSGNEGLQFSHLLKKYLPDIQLKQFPHYLFTWKHCATAYKCAYEESKKHDKKLVKPKQVIKFWARLPF